MRSNQFSRIHSSCEAPRHGAAGELIDFLKHNKKWWLAPILAMMALLGGLMIAGSSAAAPFVYTLF